MGRALALFETSDYLTEILIRHPEEIATLAELEEARAARRADTCSILRVEKSLGLARKRLEIRCLLTWPIRRRPMRRKLALLRQHFRHRASRWERGT